MGPVGDAGGVIWGRLGYGWGACQQGADAFQPGSDANVPARVSSPLAVSALR